MESAIEAEQPVSGRRSRGARGQGRGRAFAWALVFKLLLATGILAYLIHRISPGQLAGAVSDMAMFPFTVACLLLVPNVGVQVMKWHILLRAGEVETRACHTARSLLVGFALGLVTPGRVGEYGRAFFIPGASRLRVAGLTAVDKGFAFLITITGGVTSALLLSLGYTIGFTKLALAGGLMVPLIIILFAPGGLVPFFERLGMGAVSAGIVSGLRILAGFTARMRLGLLALSSLFYVIYIGQFTLLAHALEPHPWMLTAQSLAVTVLAKTFLSITVGDLGIREGAAVFFLSFIGYGEAAAFNAAIILFVINLVIPGALGLIVFIAGRINGASRTQT